MTKKIKKTKSKRVAETSIGVTHALKKQLIAESPHPRATFQEIIEFLIKNQKKARK